MIYRVFSVLVLSSLFFISPVMAQAPIPLVKRVVPAPKVTIYKPVLTDDQIETREIIRLLFGEEMVKVVNCESGFKQFRSEGVPLVSPTSDVGVMQINQVHWERAKSLGLDIFNSKVDNIIMGKILYDEGGKDHWVCADIVL